MTDTTTDVREGQPSPLALIASELAALLDEMEERDARMTADLDRIEAAVTRLEERQEVTA